MDVIKRYGYTGAFRLLLSYIRTKLFYAPARLIRFPFDIRNAKQIRLGKNFTTGFGCRLEAHPLKGENGYCIEIGEDVQINDYVHIVAGEKVSIGNNVLLASKIFITDLNHGSYGLNNIHDSPESIPARRTLSSSPVTIEDNVWIGEFVSVLPGVTIGKGSIIGTMSVVTKSIPPYCIAAGSPAVVIKKYDFEKKEWVRQN